MPRALVSYLKLFRFPLVFTAIADSAAGYLLAQRGPRDPRVLALLAAASSGLYFFGMALNDIADLERDRKIAPQRVLPSGRISRRGAIVATSLVTLISLAAVLLVPCAPTARLLVWACIVVSIVAYDLFLKVPPVMGLVRAGNFLLGVFCASSADEWHGSVLDPFTYPPYFVLAFIPFAYVSALTFVSTLEEGEVRRRVVMIGAFAMAAAAILPEFLVPRQLGRTVAVQAWIVSGILAAWIAVRAMNARDRKGVMLLVRDGIGGIIFLNAATLLSAGMTVSGLAVAALVLPAAASVAGFKKLA